MIRSQIGTADGNLSFHSWTFTSTTKTEKTLWQEKVMHYKDTHIIGKEKLVPKDT